jgi:hypothetical protein
MSGMSHASTPRPESLEREWWRRTLAVAMRPRAVFAALRASDEEDVEARQEPVLAIILLAGIGSILTTPAWAEIMDDPTRDAVVVAVITFIGGSIYGTAFYWIAGVALGLSLRGLGGDGTNQRSRHVLAFAAVPLVLLTAVTLVELAVYGGDVFRTGGDDDGAGGIVFDVVRAALVGWAVVLLVLGIRVVERFPWPRIAGALALVVVFVSAFSVVANGLS